LHEIHTKTVGDLLMKQFVAALAIVAVSTLAANRQAIAASSTFYADLAAFSAAAGGPLLLQDFSSYPNATNLRNVEFLPGVSVNSNMDSVEAFTADGTMLFGLGGRENGGAYYDVNLTLPHRAVAFDITSFEAEPAVPSTAQGPGLLTVFFTDASAAT
jgi:hypothetical protein